MGIESGTTHKKEKGKAPGFGAFRGRGWDAAIPSSALPGKAFTRRACLAGGVGTLISQSPIPIPVVPHLQKPPAELEEPEQQLQ